MESESGKQADPGVLGNARLTALTGLALLIMLIVEVATLSSLHANLSIHVFVGLMLIPVVGLKLLSTGWRFASYYRGEERYRHAGPPPWTLRLLAPLLVAATTLLLASGVALVALPHKWGQVFLGLHKASFALFLLLIGAHLLGHLGRIFGYLGGELLNKPRIAKRRGRLLAVFASMIAGAAIAALCLAIWPSWTQWHFFGDRGDDRGHYQMGR